MYLKCGSMYCILAHEVHIARMGRQLGDYPNAIYSQYASTKL